MPLPPPPHAPPLLFAPYGVWHSTQSGKKKKHSCVGGGKAVYFVRPEIWFRSSRSWKTKKQTEGEGRQTDSRRTDGRTFPVSANSPKNLQAATQVSPFVTFWLKAAAAQWSQIKSPWCVKSEPLHESLNGHGDIRFQSLFFFCFGSIARTDLTRRLASFASIYHQTSADFTGALRESCCAGFLTPQRQKLAHRTLCAFHVRRWFFPPSSRKQSGHNCALYMVKSSFVWRKRLAARLPCKVLEVRQSW